MKLRLQADADLNHQIVTGLRRLEPSIDFQTAGAAALDGKLDPEVLALCAASQRLLVMHDQRTMPHHFGEFIAAQPSPGVIIVPQHLPVAHAIGELYLAWSASEASEWTNAIRRLPL